MSGQLHDEAALPPGKDKLKRRLGDFQGLNVDSAVARNKTNFAQPVVRNYRRR